jgi:hypothetical protein
MKLRFHGNSLRLRLSQSEVAQLADSGCVEDRVEFTPARPLRYRLESGDSASVTADFTGDCIRVTLPRSVASHWIQSDETGIEGSSATLKVFVEKDFQCLHRDSPEDADSFPNPLANADGKVTR